MLEKFLEVEGVEELTGKEQKSIVGGDDDRKGGKVEV